MWRSEKMPNSQGTHRSPRKRIGRLRNGNNGLGKLDLIKIVQEIPLVPWSASPCRHEKCPGVQNPVQCKGRVVRGSSGGGRAPVHSGEFPRCEGSERTRGMGRQENTPNWLKAQIQRLMAQTGGERCGAWFGKCLRSPGSQGVCGEGVTAVLLQENPGSCSPDPPGF